MSYDVIVIGLGAAGSATLHELSRRGARVLGIDAHDPPHEFGSSHGETRITREAIGEGEIYVPLARRSHALWRRNEFEAGRTLLHDTGLAIIGRLDLPANHAGKPDFLRRTIHAARTFGIDHDIISTSEARRRFPQLKVADSETVYFEPSAGMLLPELCIATQLELARRHGGEIRTGEVVRQVTQSGGEVAVESTARTYRAGQVIVAAGAWTPGLLGGTYMEILRPYRQTLIWFEAENPEAFNPERSPVFIWMHGGGEEDWFYGFPRLPGQTSVKVAVERFNAPLAHADDVDRLAPDSDIDFAWRQHISDRILGLRREGARAATCLYTMAPDSRFLIGRDPDRQRIIVLSACSGHGFKHSPAIGEAVAALALESEAPAILAPFDPAFALAVANGR